MIPKEYLNLKYSNKTTILFLSWRDISHPKKGGAEVFTHEMLKRLDFNKYRIIHYAPIANNLEEFEIIDDVVYLRKGNSATVVFWAFMYYESNKENIDFVVDQCNTHHFMTPLWVEKSKRIFFIHQFTREIWCMNIKSGICKIGDATETPLIQASKDDYTITVSDSTKNELIEIGFDPKKIYILPEGIEFKHWKEEDFLKKEENPTFIYVGRFSNYKGIDDVVMAYANFKQKLTNAKLWIVGKKDENYIKNILEPILKEYKVTSSSEENKADVTYFGFVSEEKKLELMSRSNALIFPSRREGWGLIITEAAAVGTPSIVYNSPGIIDAVNKGEAGYLCKVNNWMEIEKYMIQVILDKDNYEINRKKAYEFSLNFHWKHTSKSFDNFINDIVKINSLY